MATSTLSLPPLPPTANDQLKDGFGRVLWGSLLAATLLHFAVIAFWPEGAARAGGAGMISAWMLYSIAVTSLLGVGALALERALLAAGRRGLCQLG
jgi:hypothetical protein